MLSNEKTKKKEKGKSHPEQCHLYEAQNHEKLNNVLFRSIILCM